MKMEKGECAGTAVPEHGTWGTACLLVLLQAWTSSLVFSLRFL